MFTRFINDVINWIKSLMIHIAVLGSRRGERRRRGILAPYLRSVPSSVSGAAGATTQLQILLMPGSTDVTARCVFSTGNAAIATIDAPTLTSISPVTIVQGTSASYTFTGTNIKGIETIGGLPAGVTASALSYTSTTVVCTLTATGGATTGADSLYLACNRGNSGTQTLTVVANLLTAPNDLTNAAWSDKTSSTTVTLVGGIVLPDSTTGTVSQVGIAAGARNYIAQPVTISGGTASKQFTVSGYVRMVSGTGTAALKNTQGGVIDNYGTDQSITTAWSHLTFAVTNGASAGTGVQKFGITNGSVGPAESVYVYGMVATQP